jgi:hypothetical protein
MHYTSDYLLLTLYYFSLIFFIIVFFSMWVPLDYSTTLHIIKKEEKKKGRGVMEEKGKRKSEKGRDKE